MARTVEECLALALASRAAAEAETLENVRRVHLEAAASWESLAQSARYVDFPDEMDAVPRHTARDHAVRELAAAPTICPDRASHPSPAVAPPARSEAVFIGDALITDRHPIESQQDASAQHQLSDGAAILYDVHGNLRTLEEIEADVIRLAIDVYRGRMAEVARRLGIGRSTLYRKLNDFGIESTNRPDGTVGM